jgi:hypothetical protein
MNPRIDWVQLAKQLQNGLMLDLKKDLMNITEGANKYYCGTTVSNINSQDQRKTTAYLYPEDKGRVFQVKIKDYIHKSRI